MTDHIPILQTHNLSKSFPGVKALKNIDFSLYPGEVHILAGENGAGKSTLTKCIQGIYAPDEGEILLEGRKVDFHASRDALDLGIASVYQELTMIPYLDAVRNIFYGNEIHRAGSPFLDFRKMNQDAREILAELHCESLDLHTPVASLSIAQQQMIEIAKALVSKPRILIFDEPTTSLTKREVTFLFEQIAHLKEQGIAILFISHRLEEVREIGDRITILRDGCLIRSCSMKEISQKEIIQLMIDRELVEHEDTSWERSCGQPILELRDLCDKKGKIQHCDIRVDKGEIVGIAGLVGAGRTELARLIYGIEEISSGEILFHGDSVKRPTPHKMVKKAMGFLPEDRKNLGLALRAPIHWNILISSLKKHFPLGLIGEKKSAEYSRVYMEELTISGNNSRKLCEELSGGNQQKVVLARWFAAQSDFIIFDEPTRGVDVGAKEEIYDLMKGLKGQGKSALVISSEMDELMRVCDRIYCMSEGTMVGQLTREEFSQEAIANRIFQHVTKGEETERRQTRRKISLPPAFYMSLLLLLFFTLKSEYFLRLSNIAAIFSQSAALLVMACGQAMVVLIQGTDLSLGAIVSYTGVLWFYLLNLGIPMPVTVLLCLLNGLLCGLLNGWISAKGRIPIFIVTLGTQNIFRSLALILSGSQTLYYGSQVFREIAQGAFLGIHWISWIAVILFLGTLLLFYGTDFGGRVRGNGGNPQGVAYSGESTVRNQLLIFIFAGIMAAISGLLVCCRIESGNPNAGLGMEFNAIAAVLLGGVSMREGKGRVEGIIFGVFLIQILKSGLSQIGMNSIYQNVTIGIAVLSAIIIDAAIKKWKSERG